MEVKISDLWLCQDCLFAAVNGDMPEDPATAEKVSKGLAALGPHLVPDFDSETGSGINEFSWRTCDCCNSPLGGSRHRFAVLG